MRQSDIDIAVIFTWNFKESFVKLTACLFILKITDNSEHVMSFRMNELSEYTQE